MFILVLSIGSSLWRSVTLSLVAEGRVRSDDPFCRPFGPLDHLLHGDLLDVEQQQVYRLGDEDPVVLYGGL